jgi:PAS domain S-box-containing protein
LDLSGVILFVNDSGLALLEAEGANGLLGKAWIDLWPESSMAVVATALRDAAAGSTTKFTASRPTEKGSPKWWEVVVAPVRDDKGCVMQIMAASRDVSKERAASETLETSALKFRALANSIAQLAWMADGSGYVFWYNDRWFDYTGSNIQEMQGWGWRSVHHPDHVDRVVRKISKCFETGEVWEDTFPLRGRDGSYRWFLSRAKPVCDDRGRVTLWCGTNTDITEELEYRQLLERKARLIELSHEAFLVRDQDDRIELWNSGCVNLFGYSREEAIGAKYDALLRTDFPGGKSEIEAALKESGEWSGEVRHQAKDGAAVLVESRLQLIENGGASVVIECDRDTSERRANDDLRNVLIGELCHRVKNSLAIVQAIATQTGRRATSVAQFLADFGGRIEAMSAAQNLLTDADWSGVDLRRLMATLTTEAFGRRACVHLQGGSVVLGAQTAMQLALILHELATNALKHGSLSDPNGRLDVTWRESPQDPSKIDILWRESGGPAVDPPLGKGFGLSLIERSKNMPFFSVDLAFEPTGAVCKIRVDMRSADTRATAYFRALKKIDAT